MSERRKATTSERQRALVAAASLRLWSRFKSCPAPLAFACPEPTKIKRESLGFLNKLPVVSHDSTVVYAIKISLEGIKPPIWRRVIVPEMTLEELHHVIQVVMGWEDCHLHGYEVRRISVPTLEDRAEVNERSITIGQLYAAKVRKFRYTYDFGDDWRHSIQIENCLPASEETLTPHCVAGRGESPIEDLGGVEGWQKLIDAMRKPDQVLDELTISLLRRLGSDFELPGFDLADTNARLRKQFSKRSR